MADKKYFIENQKENEEKTTCFLELTDFELSNVEDDINSGYRALSLQVFGTEEKHSDLRKIIYDFLVNNLEHLKKYGFEKDGRIIYTEEYLDIPKILKYNPSPSMKIENFDGFLTEPNF